MTIEQLASIAEIIGVIVVVVTFVYLSIQLRQNTRALRSTGAQSTHDGLGAYYLALANDKTLLNTFRKGTDDMSLLDDQETAQVYALWTYTLYQTQNWLYQRRTGALDPELTDSWLASVSDNFHSAGFQQYWANRKHYFSTSLREYVDAEIANPSTKSGYTMMGPYAG